MRQNITIKKQYSCLLERGSRNCLLYLLLPFLHFFSRPFLVIFLLLLLRERSILSASSVIFSLFFFALSHISSLSSPFFHRTNAIESVHRRDVTSIYIYTYKNFVYRKKKTERKSTHGLPPDPNSSTSPRYFRSTVLALLLPTNSLPMLFPITGGYTSLSSLDT